MARESTGVSAEQSKPSTGDEAAIERTVRGILQRLDRNIETANSWGCSLAGLILAPLLFLGLWWGSWSLWLAIPLAIVGPLLLWIVFWNVYDRHAAQREAQQFNQLFPVGHPDRDLAVQMLSEMPYPTLAHEKLRSALLGRP